MPIVLLVMSRDVGKVPALLSLAGSITEMQILFAIASLARNLLVAAVHTSACVRGELSIVGLKEHLIVASGPVRKIGEMDVGRAAIAVPAEVAGKAPTLSATET